MQIDTLQHFTDFSVPEYDVTVLFIILLYQQGNVFKKTKSLALNYITMRKRVPLCCALQSFIIQRNFLVFSSSLSDSAVTLQPTEKMINSSLRTPFWRIFLLFCFIYVIKINYPLKLVCVVIQGLYYVSY